MSLYCKCPPCVVAGFWSIIQVLSRKGIYIADVQDTEVTEAVLVQAAPFKLVSQHNITD